MNDTDQLWMDSYGFIYSADGKRLLKGASVEGAYWLMCMSMTNWCLARMRRRTKR